MKARQEQALMVGWHARNFHYVKDLKPLGKYLEPAPSPERRREDGNRALLTMFKRHAKKGKR